MWTLFSISLGKNRPEFSLRGVATYTRGDNGVMFQGTANGAVFVEGPDYESVRAVVLDVVEMNKVDKNGLQ